MGVREIHGDADWNAAQLAAGGKLVVADFSATWCGPCQRIKPIYEQFSRQYPDVVFLEINEANNRSLLSVLGVRSFPTFHFYMNQRKVDEMVGADPQGLKTRIEKWQQSVFNPFASPGVALGGSAAASTAPSPTDVAAAREARLKRFNNINLVPTTIPNLTPAPAPTAVPSPAPVAKVNEEKNTAPPGWVCDPETGTCRPEKKQDEEEKKEEDDAEPMDTTESNESSLPPVNEELLAQLLDMGFSDLRSRKALLSTMETPTLEAAITWIDNHQDDEDIDEPIKFVDLSKTTKQLTPEEKAAKMEEMKQRMAQKRKEREEREAKERIQAEIKRREEGKNLSSAKEEYEAMQRRIAAEKIKADKLAYKREREMIKRKLEQDKLERRARGGKLGGAPLDVVNPDVAKQMSALEEAAAHAQENFEAKRPAPATQLSPKEQLLAHVATMKKYRVGNDGLTCLKTLNVYVKNLLEKPEEDKFRTINLENPAFRKRVAGIIGGVGFLKTLGYEKDSNDGLLKLAPEKVDQTLISYAKTVLESGIAELSN